MVHQIYTTEKPADPRRAVAFSIAVILTSLAAAWGVQQLTRAGQAVVLGQRVNPENSPFSLRLPDDWQLDDDGSASPSNIFVFRKKMGTQSVGSLFLLSGPGADTAPDFALKQLTEIAGTQAQRVPQLEDVTFGPNLQGLQIVANLPNASIVCRTAKGPRGNLYSLLVIMKRSFGAQAAQFLDQVAETIQWNRLQVTKDMNVVNNAVGLRIEPPEGTTFAFDPDASAPFLYLFADEATDHGWHASISPTVLVDPRRVIDMAQDQRIDLGWDGQEAQSVELSDDRQAAVISRQTRALYLASWTIQLRPDRAAVVQFQAPGEDADQAHAVCRRIADSLTMTEDLLQFDNESAVAAGRDVIDQIHDRGLSTWWTEQAQTLLYIRWEQGRASQWITQQRETVGDNQIEGYRMRQDYFGANPLGQPKKVFSLAWDLNNTGMDVHEPADPEDRYVTVPAFDLATYLLTRQTNAKHALIRVSLTDDPSRRFWKVCKVLPPQPSAESPGKTEFRVQTASDYSPRPHVMVFDEQGILIREELDDVLIKRASEEQIKQIFFQRKMIRLEMEDGES
jgi:hypothetical protein